MNTQEAFAAVKLIEYRRGLLSKLNLLKKSAGYPAASLTYLNNASAGVSVSIPDEVQQLVETFIETILLKQISETEVKLSKLGVTVE